MKKLINIFLGGLLGLTTLTLTPAWAVQAQLIDLESITQQGRELGLQWSVHGLQGQSVKEAKLIVDGQPVTSQSKLEPARGKSICYLLMVDNSGSMNRYRANLDKLLKSLIEKKNDQHYLGLVLFAKEWKELQPFTKDKTVLLSKIGSKQIKLKGKVTELLRFANKGVSALDTCPAESYRKVLIIISDGDAEDEKYGVDPTIKSAQNKHVSIYSFGFKKTDKSFLEYPRRLSEETGGWLAEPKKHTKKQQNKASLALYADSNTGGELQATLPEGKPEKSAQLKVTLSDGKILTIDLSKDVKIKKQAQEIPAWKKKILDRFPQIEKQLDYILWGIGLILFGLLAWLLFRLLRRNATDVEPPRNIEGYLAHQGESHAVYSGITRLGFLPNNDVVIDNDTVGRTHATLHYRGEGDIVLTDLNSLNGTFINDTRIERPSSIQNGDTIRLGGWTAIFQRVEDEQNTNPQ